MDSCNNIIVEESKRLTKKMEMTEREQEVRATSVKSTKPRQRFAATRKRIRYFPCSQMGHIIRDCKNLPSDIRESDPMEETKQPRSSQQSRF